jgi:hypothetical protein
MLEIFLATFIASVIFCTYEFYKIKIMYESDSRYYRFFSGMGLSSPFEKELMRNEGSHVSDKFGDIDNRLHNIQTQIKNQEDVISKLIRQLSEV